MNGLKFIHKMLRPDQWIGNIMQPLCVMFETDWIEAAGIQRG